MSLDFERTEMMGSVKKPALFTSETTDKPIISTQTIVDTNKTPFIFFIASIIIILTIFLLSENTNNSIFKQVMEVIKKVNMIVTLPTFLIAAIAVFEMSRPIHPEVEGPGAEIFIKDRFA